jgi:hypothetical protein
LLIQKQRKFLFDAFIREHWTNVLRCAGIRISINSYSRGGEDQ